jgi:hypothetical protein
MARRSVKRNITQIDPTFLIPDGVDEFAYKELVFTEDFSEDEILEDVFLEEGDTVVDEDEVGLEAPDEVIIVSQKVITSPGGMQTIEVTLEVEDIMGADTYEVRKTLL